jgi:hypothetical protein
VLTADVGAAHADVLNAPVDVAPAQPEKPPWRRSVIAAARTRTPAVLSDWIGGVVAGGDFVSAFVARAGPPSFASHIRPRRLTTPARAWYIVGRTVP